MRPATCTGEGIAEACGERDLLAAVILQALKDAHDGRPCDGACRPYAHQCRRDALRFLRSHWCACILSWLDFPPEVQEDLVAQAKNGKGSKERRTLKTE